MNGDGASRGCAGYALRMNANDTEWYWCLDHEAAEHWRERVEQRNEAWDAEDEAWEGDE